MLLLTLWLWARPVAIWHLSFFSCEMGIAITVTHVKDLAQALACRRCSGGENSLCYSELPGQELQTHRPSAKASHRLVLLSGHCGFSNLNLNVFRKGHTSPGQARDLTTPYIKKKKKYHIASHISLYSLASQGIMADYILQSGQNYSCHSYALLAVWRTQPALPLRGEVSVLSSWIRVKCGYSMSAAMCFPHSEVWS